MRAFAGKMYSKPRLLHNVYWPEEKEVFPPDARPFWLGSGYVVLVSREEAWYTLDVLTGRVILIRWRCELPSRIEKDEPLGESGLVPNEETVDAINRYLKGDPDVEAESHISVMCIKTSDNSTISTVFDKDKVLDYALSSWALQTEDAEVLVGAWKVALNGEEIGTFLSDQKPLVAFGGQICGYSWFILVRRWDYGFDIYRVDDVQI